MGFADELSMAERALEQDRSEDESFPPTAKRFREARARLGISEGQVAERWGFQPSLYWDLELHNSEVFTCVGVFELPPLARALETSLMQLLFGADPPEVIPAITYSEIVRGITNRADAAGLTLQQLGDTVGWDLEPLVSDPRAIGTYNLGGLYAICKAADVDWIGVLMEAEQSVPRDARNARA